MLHGTIRRKVRLYPEQQAFRRSPKLFRAFVGGRGAGKSWCGAFDLIRRARPGRTYLIGSPTGVLMGDTTYPTFKEIATQLGIWGGAKLSPYPTATLLLEGGEASIRFRTAEDPEKMRGPNLTAVWLDEASLMHEDVYKVVIGCLREYGRMGWLSATFTPKGPSHWTHGVFNSGHPDTFIVRAPTAANPFNPPNFAETIRKQYGNTQFMRQELEGEFVQLEGAEWSAPLVYLTDPAGKNPRRWFTDWPKPEDVVARVIALDPSKGVSDYVRKAGSRQSDYQAFALAVLDKLGTIWAEAWGLRLSVPDMIQFGVNLVREHAPLSRFVVEDNDGLGMLVTEFKRQLREQVVIVPLVAQRNTVNKVFRLRRLGGYLTNEHPDYGPQLRVRDTEGGRILVGQMLDFPAGEYDDLLDALEMAVGQLESLVAGG